MRSRGASHGIARPQNCGGEAVEKLFSPSDDVLSLRARIDLLKSIALSCPKMRLDLCTFAAHVVFLKPR
jgi:hypothetical protein